MSHRRADWPLRDAAKRQGKARYFTGVPCAHGHTAPRFTANGRCVECNREYVLGSGAKVRQQWFQSEAGRAAIRRGRKKYKASVKGRAADRAWRLNSSNVRDHSRYQSAKRKGHKPPPKERECPARPVDNRCQCCHEISSKRLVLDHDHATGAFRGWICGGCNLGSAKPDNVSWLQMRIAYLESPPWATMLV